MHEELAIPLDGFKFMEEDDRESITLSDGAYAMAFLDDGATAYIPMKPLQGDKVFLLDNGKYFMLSIVSIMNESATDLDRAGTDENEPFLLSVKEHEINLSMLCVDTKEIDVLPELEIKKDFRKYTVVPSGPGLYSVYPWVSGCSHMNALFVGSAEELESSFFASFSCSEESGVKCYLGEKGLELQVGRVVRLLPYQGRDPVRLKENFISILQEKFKQISEEANRTPHAFVANPVIDKVFDKAVACTKGLPVYRITPSNSALATVLLQKFRKTPRRYANIKREENGTVIFRPGSELLPYAALDDAMGDCILDVVQNVLHEHGMEDDTVRCAVRYSSQGFGGYTEIDQDGKIADSWRMELSPMKSEAAEYEQRFMDKVFFEDKNFHTAFKECLSQLYDIMEENDESLYQLNPSIANRYADELKLELRQIGAEAKGKPSNAVDAYAKHYTAITMAEDRTARQNAEKSSMQGGSSALQTAYVSKQMEQEHAKNLAIAEGMLREGFNENAVRKALMKMSVYVKCYARPKSIRDYCGCTIRDAKIRIQNKKIAFR